MTRRWPTRRTTTLAAVAVLGCLSLVGGVVLLLSNTSGGRRVAGIVLVVLGLACVRVLTWARRIRAMTRAGLARRPEPPEQK